MVRLKGGGRARSCALVVLVLAAALAPAVAEQGTDVRYTVTFSETKRFEGDVRPATFKCPAAGACAGAMRVGTRGWLYEYTLFAETSGDRFLLFFWRRSPRAAELNHERGDPIRVTLGQDGTGGRDVALAALLRPGWDSDYDRFLVLPGRHWAPLANVRVTVRREEAEKQSR